MQALPSTDKEQNKGIKGGNFAARRAFWQARDALLEGWVDRYEVIDRELAAALLGWAHTIPNLKLAERRLRKLAWRGRFQQWHKEDTVFSVTLKISLRRKEEQKQLAHHYMGARRAALFEMNFKEGHYEYIGGRECWNIGGTIIPDDAWKIGTPTGTAAIFCEDETGRSALSKAVEKVQTYWIQRDVLKSDYSTPSMKLEEFLVLFHCKDPLWIPKIAAAVRQLPEDAWDMFYLVEEGKLNPFDAASMRQPVYLSPKDMQYHGLLED